MEGGLIEIKTFDEQLKAAIAALRSSESGISLGFPEIEHFMDARGFQPGQFVVLLAQPKVGKTAWVVNAMSNLLSQGKRSLFISVEMSATRILHRLIRLAAGVDYMTMKDRSINDPNGLYHEVRNKTKNLVTVCDHKEISVPAIKALYDRLKPAAIFIDYLQILHAAGEKEQERVSRIAKGLADFAQTSGALVVALSQTTRSVDTPPWKMPDPASGRWSGDIHIACDVIMGMCRLDTNPSVSEKNRFKIELQILETRDGASSPKIAYHYDPESMRLQHWDTWFSTQFQKNMGVPQSDDSPADVGQEGDIGIF